MVWTKYDLGLLAPLLVSALGCGTRKPEIAASQASTPSCAEAARAPRSDAPALDTSTLARERLGMLKQEVLRVSSRLELEGTAGQREHWHDELSAIDHDCNELSAQWQDAEQMPQPDRAAVHARLVELIDVLYAVNARTAAAIESSLNAGAK